MKPMLSQSLEIGKPKDANQWARVQEDFYYMEPKLDGWRILLDFTGPTFHAWTRSGRDIAESLAGWVTTFDPDPYAGLMLDAELGYPTCWFQIDYNMTARVLGSGPDVAIAKWEAHMERRMNLAAFVFDVPTYIELTQSARNRMLATIIGNKDPLAEPICRVTELGPWNETKYEELVDRGAEGVMLKNAQAWYHYDARPTQTWYKVKKYETEDAVIVNFEPGQGKYEGQIGNVVFQLEDGRVGKCSGMDDATRRDMSDNRDDWLGRWIEVRFYGGVGRDKQGMRHPQFKRVRDDK